MKYSQERRHIHELANHLTIIQGAVKKVIRNIDEKKTRFARRERTPGQSGRLFEEEHRVAARAAGQYSSEDRRER